MAVVDDFVEIEQRPKEATKKVNSEFMILATASELKVIHSTRKVLIHLIESQIDRKAG